jgi:hypothetical protein
LSPPQWSRTHPNCVYLIGTLVEGAGFRDVVIHPSQPNKIVAGFGGDTDGPFIRANGHLVFTDWEKAYSFEPEHAPFSS